MYFYVLGLTPLLSITGLGFRGHVYSTHLRLAHCALDDAIYTGVDNNNERRERQTLDSFWICLSLADRLKVSGCLQQREWLDYGLLQREHPESSREISPEAQANKRDEYIRPHPQHYTGTSGDSSWQCGSVDLSDDDVIVSHIILDDWRERSLLWASSNTTERSLSEALWNQRGQFWCCCLFQEPG